MVPIPGLGGTPSQGGVVPGPGLDGGYPIPGWGVPQPGLDGGGYPRYPLPSRPGRGTPNHPDLGWNTPPPDLRWGTPPPPRPAMGYPPPT